MMEDWKMHIDWFRLWKSMLLSWVVYSAILDIIGKFGGLQSLLELLSEMEKESSIFKPNVVNCKYWINISVTIVGPSNPWTLWIRWRGFTMIGIYKMLMRSLIKLLKHTAFWDEYCSTLVLALLQFVRFKDAEIIWRMMLTWWLEAWWCGFEYFYSLVWFGGTVRCILLVWWNWEVGKLNSEFLISIQFF